MQLIGAYAWDDAEDPLRGIIATDVERAVADAVRQFGLHVYGPVWHGLSDLDKKFLVAMLVDTHSSATPDIGRRWGHDARSLSTYRGRLTAVGLITPVGRGRVSYADSAVRSYVTARAVAEGWDTELSLDIPQPEPNERTGTYTD